MTFARAARSLVVVGALHSSVDCQFAGLHDFSADDHLVEDLVHLVEVEDEIEFAHAAEVLVQHFHEQVDEFKHGKFVVLSIYAQCEEKSRVPPIHYLMVPVLPHPHTQVKHDEFLRFGLPILTSRKLVILLSRETIVRCVSVSIFFLSSSLYETYHLLNLVFPCRFCRRMNLICATN